MIKIKLEDSHIIINDNSRSKKSILEKISDILSEPSGIKKSIIFNTLYEREKLGSTSVGKGVALPHARVNDIDYPFVCIIILDEPIDFDNIDNLDVDIILSIIVPADNFDNHLELLAYFSEKLDDPKIRRELRKARNSEQILKNFASDNIEFI